MTHSKLSRRQTLLLLTFGISALAVFPADAKKKRPRKRHRGKDWDDDDDNSSPSPTPTATPTPAQPERYTPPNPALIPAIGGGVLGLFGLVGAWLWKINRKASEQVSKISARPPARSKPVDLIEQELNQMRTASGMTRVKPPKQASRTATETPEWYVFRSGRAEGPYTKMQLLEIQQITDRTKVRRGETDWQRAGEIPELAAYLTEK